ncbi:MAG: protein bicaudal D-like protein, partial [Candidatus Parvarchaeota archaeon]|nr:protein bicaudal D-like protein [Candidatus Jingweiarchaeum tengchongense]
GKVWELIPEPIKAPIKWIGDSLKPIANALDGFLKDPVGSLKKGFDGVVSNIGAMFDGAVSSIGNFFKPVIDAISNIGNWLYSGLQLIGQKVVDGGKMLLDGAAKLGSLIWSGFLEAGKGLIDLGKGALGVFNEMIKGVIGFFSDFVLKPLSDVFTSSTSSIHKTIGLSSPQKIWSDALIPLAPMLASYLGLGLVSNLAEGIGDTKVEAATLGIRPGILKIIKGIDLRGIMGAVLTGYITGLSMSYFSGTVMEQVRRESLEAGRPIPPNPETAAWMLRKKIIDEKLYSKAIARSGYMKEFEKAYIENIWMYPPYQDMIKIFVREAYEKTWPEEFTKKLEGYPSDFGKWMEYIGYKEEWAKRLWAAHWILPSTGQVYEMLWRKLTSPYTGAPFTISDVERFLKEADIDPRWRSNLVQIAYKLPGRIEARWGLEWGVWDEQKFVTFLEAEGIHPDWIPDTLKAEKANIFREHINAVKSAIVRKVKEGFLTFETAKAMLKKIGYPDEAINLIIQAAQEDYELDWKTSLRDAYINAYHQEKIDEAKLRELLTSIGIVPERVDKIIEGERYKKKVEKEEKETVELRLQRLKMRENEQILRVQDAQSDLDYAKSRLEAEKAIWEEKIKKLEYEISIETVEYRKKKKMLDLEKMRKDYDRAMIIAQNRVTEAEEKLKIEEAQLDAIRFEISTLAKVQAA